MKKYYQLTNVILKSYCILVGIIILLVAIGIFPHKAHAQVNYTWNGSVSSAWTNSSNWTPNTGFPGTLDNVTIVTAGFQPVLDIPCSVNNLTVSSGIVNLNTFTLTTTGTSVFSGGSINNGNLVINGSSATFSGTVFGAVVNANASSILLNGSVFNSSCSFNKNGSVSNNSNGGNIFNAAVSISTTGTGNLTLSNINKDIFNADVTFGSVSSTIYVAHNDNTGTQFNGNIYLNSTGSSGGIRFSQGTGKSILAATKTISISAPGFSSGGLYLKNFVQLGTTSQSMTSFSGTSALFLQSGNIFNGDVTFTAPQLLLDGSTYNGTAVLEKNGAGNNWSLGGNTFNGITTIINSGSNELILGGTSRDIFNNDVTFTNNGSSKTHIGYNDNTGTLFNGNIILNSTGLSTGINFSYGMGTCYLASGKTISIGSNGFSSGILYLRNFIQLGNTPQVMTTFSGTTTLQMEGGNTFNGNVTFTAPQVWCKATTFNSTTRIEKNGATSNYWYGGNVFNGVTTIVNSGSGILDLAQTAGDDFNNDVQFIKTGTARISPLVNGTSTFAGNISTVGSNAQVSFGYNWSGGRMIIDGVTNQNFNGDVSFPPAVRALTINKPSGTLSLNINVSIITDIAFTAGIINANTSSSTGNGLLILNNGITVSDAADNGSYVNGFVRKIGNAAFSFPVGNAGYYVPVSISAPSSVSDHFTAKYVHQGPHSLYDTTSHDATIQHISDCEYWILDRTAGSSGVTVTLHWNGACSPMTTLPDLRVARWNGAVWKDHGNGGVTGTMSAGTVLSAGPVTSFSPFTFASTSAITPLPVELVSFSGECVDNSLQLNWETSSEVNNAFFVVEGSENPTDWEQLDTVAGHGSTNVFHQYKFNISSHIHYPYYRLKQMDYNGEFVYSDIIYVENCGETVTNDGITVYPNPTKGIVNISSATEINHISVWSMTGSNVSAIHVDRINQQVDFSNVSKGIYFIQMDLGGQQVTKKIIFD